MTYRYPILALSVLWSAACSSSAQPGDVQAGPDQSTAPADALPDVTADDGAPETQTYDVASDLPPDDVAPDDVAPDAPPAPDPQCEQQPFGTPCEGDLDLCTLEACDALAQCSSTGDTLKCDELPAGPCEHVTCKPQQGCAKEPLPDGAVCDDDNLCTEDDACQYGHCRGTPAAMDCRDGDPCTLDVCDPQTGCANPPDQSPLCGVACGPRLEPQWETWQAPLPGTYQSVDLRGDLAYVGHSVGLDVIDLSDPTKPVWLGRLPLPDAATVGIDVEGDYAYVAHHGHIDAALEGLTIVDVNDPLAPSEKGFVPLPQAGVVARHPTSDVAYVGYEYGFAVLDSSSPDYPQVQDSVEPAFARLLALEGDRLYVVSVDYEGPTAGLRVFDVAAPASPLLLEEFSLPGHPDDLAVEGANVLFLAGPLSGPRTLTLLEVSPAGELSEVQSVTEVATAVALHNGAYSCGAEGLRTHLLADLSTALPVANVPPCEDLAVSEDGAYAVVVGDAGLQVVNLAAGVVVGELAPSYPAGDTFGVAAANGYVYAAVEGTLAVYDVMDPSVSPQQLSATGAPGIAAPFLMQDELLYVEASPGLRIYDVSTPTTPALVGQLDCPSAADWDLAGDRLLLADGTTVHLIDVSDATAPVELSELHVWVAFGVAVRGPHAYIAGTGLLEIVSFAGDVLVKLDKAMPASEHGYAIDVAGSVLWVVDDDRQLRGIDVSDPTSPQLVSQLELVYQGRDIEVVGDFAIVTSWNAVQLVNVSNPAAPELVDCLSVPGKVVALDVEGGFVYLAATDGGVHVVHVGCAGL